mgnify:CR=1 FL=1
MKHVDKSKDSDLKQRLEGMTDDQLEKWKELLDDPGALLSVKQVLRKVLQARGIQ